MHHFILTAYPHSGQNFDVLQYLIVIVIFKEVFGSGIENLCSARSALN